MPTIIDVYPTFAIIVCSSLQLPAARPRVKMVGSPSCPVGWALVMFDTFFAWRFPIGRVFGITVHVHLAFLLVLLPLTLSFSLDKDSYPGTWSDACLLAVLMTLSILLHEMGHCFGARSVGGQADEIMLWPLGGLAECSFLPASPWANFVFTICGPLANVILCVVSALVLAFGFEESIRPIFNFVAWNPF